MLIHNKNYPKSKIEKIAKEILHKYSPGEKLKGNDLEFIMYLLRYHPKYEEKTKYGVKGIIVRTNPRRRDSKQFRIITKDGKEIEFSYLKCLHNYKRTHKYLVLNALRDAIKEQILEFKKNYFKKYGYFAKCAVSGKKVTWENSHIDHIIPFKKLVDEFMNMNGLTFDKIEIFDDPLSNNPPKLKDRELERKWKEFHKQKAALRVVSQDVHKMISVGKIRRGQITLTEWMNNTQAGHQ